MSAAELVRPLADAEGLRREAMQGLRRAQLAYQSLLNVIEQGGEPLDRDYARVARHMRLAFGALEAMRDTLKGGAR